MNLTGIISISGRPGLFKVIVQGKNNVIVESLVDKKRFPAYSSDRISALDDISIYTHDQEKPLREIFKSIFEKEKGAETISAKNTAKTPKGIKAKTVNPKGKEDKILGTKTMSTQNNI